MKAQARSWTGGDSNRRDYKIAVRKAGRMGAVRMIEKRVFRTSMVNGVGCYCTAESDEDRESAIWLDTMEITNDWKQQI